MKTVLGIFVLLFVLQVPELFSQGSENGSIRGHVLNSRNREPVPFANVVIFNTNNGTSSDFDGNFSFDGLKPGMVELRVSAIGFSAYISGELMITNARTLFLEVLLEES
jgi:hypothetical protein